MFNFYLTLLSEISKIFYKIFFFYKLLLGNNVVSYVDMLFSNYDMLIALSGFPDYSFRIWNCRTGNLLVEVATGIKCSVHSLHCSSRTWPLIMQFSKFEKAIVFWEMHYTAEAMVLHEISRVQLPKSHLLSTQFAMCSQNDVMYVVNDFGVVFSVSYGCNYLLVKLSYQLLFLFTDRSSTILLVTSVGHHILTP